MDKIFCIIQAQTRRSTPTPIPTIRACVMSTIGDIFTIHCTTHYFALMTIGAVPKRVPPLFYSEKENRLLSLIYSTTTFLILFSYSVSGFSDNAFIYYLKFCNNTGANTPSSICFVNSVVYIMSYSQTNRSI